jgi:hypothetical protein
MRLQLFTIAVSLSVAACSTLTYQEPTSGQRARVRFVTDSDSSVVSVLRTYSDENCANNEADWMKLRNGQLLNSSPRRLGIPLWSYHENAGKEVYVEANKEIHGLFHGNEIFGGGTYSCGVPFSSSFKEHSDYEVRFKWAPKACRVTISQVVSSPKGFELRELATFSNQATEVNKGCLAAFRKLRLY